jgi:hypothetical protein
LAIRSLVIEGLIGEFLDWVICDYSEIELAIRDLARSSVMGEESRIGNPKSGNTRQSPNNRQSQKSAIAQ